MKLFKQISFTFIIMIILVFISSCDSTEKTDNKNANDGDSYPRIVNSKEASLLARTLYHNTELGNGAYKIQNGTLGSGGFLGSGFVDWKSLNVAIRISLVNEQRIDISSITTSNEVFESVFNLNSELTKAGYDPFDWVARKFDPNIYGIDSISQFILKLGATSPDNPILIKQNGATILGIENVNGVKTYKMVNDGSITYYVDEQGALLRVEADIKGFKGVTTIDFLSHQKSEVDVPAEKDSISIEKISQLYSTIRPNF